MRLGSFDVTVCVVKIVFTEKELGEGVMIPKQRLFPVGGDCDSDGCLEMANGLLSSQSALGLTYLAKNTVRSTDPKVLAFPWRSTGIPRSSHDVQQRAGIVTQG